MKFDLNDERLEVVGDGIQSDFPAEVLAAAAAAAAGEELTARFCETIEDEEGWHGHWYGLTPTRLILIHGRPKRATQYNDGEPAGVSGEVIDLGTVASVTINSFAAKPVGGINRAIDLRVASVTLRIIDREVELPQGRVTASSLERWEPFCGAVLRAVGCGERGQSHAAVEQERAK